ncbi:hypothetical protein RvY_05089 [Ramazzottius varieornatus]|uniref:Uncharacterized protein n=1 Tax=Ramazzottius varieornatus TaxID=947166 RepID=A0A1D1UZL6_RAMVA|nr:hypothetical protein RvY_05089 [Ramazzottius varieornatus]
MLQLGCAPVHTVSLLLALSVTFTLSIQPSTVVPTETPTPVEDQLQQYPDEQSIWNEEVSLRGPAKITRDVRAKYDPTYRWLGIGKRDSDPLPRPAKFGQFSFGLGKRDTKYSPNYRFIGLGKRMAPYWHSSMLKGFLEGESQKSRVAGPSAAAMRPWHPAYSAMTKKLTSDYESPDLIPVSYEDMDTANDVPSGFGRPVMRGGSTFEPIYRYVGLG